MTIDEVIAAINSAKKGEAHDLALGYIQELSQDDRELAGADLEEMAILVDNS